MLAPVGGPLLEDWHAAPLATGVLAKREPQNEHGLGKTARAKQRMRAVPAASRKKQHGLSFLERASLRRTFPRYAALWADFVKFGRRRGVSSKTRAAIDEQGAEFLSVRFFAGDLPGVGGYTIATFREFEPMVVKAGRGAVALSSALYLEATETLQYKVKQPTLYQLRHGEASADAARHDHNLPEIQPHGRWADQNPVRRCAKGGRVTQRLWLLEKPVRAKRLAAARRIGEILSTTLFSSCARTGRAR